MTPEEEKDNTDAKEKREKKKAALQGLSHAEEGPTFVSLDEKLALDVSNTTRDDEIDYSGFRASKRVGAVEIKLEISISQQQQQQQQEQQQQQQQQQQQVTQTQQIRAPALKDFSPYQGYKDLISIQKFDHGKKTDTKAVLKELGVSAYTKLQKLGGTHDSQCGGIGYISMAAAKEISKPDFLPQFISGVYLDPSKPEDYLPDGFCLLMTGGERNLAFVPEPAAKSTEKSEAKENNYDRREFPRLVLDYKPDLKNGSKHPFKMRLIPLPKSCTVIGTPAQFNMPGSKYEFRRFERDDITIPLFSSFEISKTKLINALRSQNLASGNAVIKKLGGHINYVAKNNTNTYLTATAENIEKSVKQSTEYIRETYSSLRKEFYKYMRAEDKVRAKKLIALYSEILDLCNSDDIFGLWEIFYTAGCVGLEVFLASMKNLFDIDKGNTFFYFKYSFFLASPNCAEFIESKAIEVFNKISTLSDIQRSWWNSLSSRHIQNCGWSDITDLYAAFNFFWNEYRRIGAAKMGADQFIELSADYSLGYVGNMKVVLPKILVIMQNARNFKEQAENLKSINFNSNDLMYASAHQNYSLVTADMVTDGFKTTEAERLMKENRIADSDLQVTFDDLSKLIYSHHITTQVFKFIGIQTESAPYQQYVDLMNYIYKNTDIPALYKLYYDVVASNKLIFIAVASTTNKRGYQCDIKQQLTVLFPYFLESYTFRLHSIFDLLIKLIADARWIGLPDIIIVAKMLFAVLDVQRNFLCAAIVELKEELVQHLHVYDANKKALDPATYISCLFKLSEEQGDEQLKAKLPRIFSLIDKKDFKLEYLKEFISILKQFKRKYGKHAHNELIDILSILKLTDSDKPRPTMQDVLFAVRSIDKISDLSVQQYIGRSLPKNCTYNPADCRSVLLKPLGVSEVLKSFELAARGVGKKVDTKELNGDNGLNYIVNIIENENDLIWKDIATKYIIKIQKEHRSKHIIKIDLSEDSDTRILLSIVHTIFCPGPFANIADSITPMLEYTQQISNFIDALIEIQKKWPQDLSELLVKICGDATVKRNSIKFLNDFLCQVTQTFSKKLPFPNDFLVLLLEHEKNHGIKSELLAIDIIFGAKAVSRDHKMQILKMNLASAALNVNAVQFTKQLIKFYDKFSHVFTRILYIIENCHSDRETVFAVTLSLLKLLVEMNNEKITDQLFNLFAGNPEAYLGILQCIFNSIPIDEITTETKVDNITPEDNPEIPTPVEPTEPQEFQPNARHIITQLVFQCCDSSEFKENEVTHIIKKLTCESESTLQSLIEMLPAPTFKTLQIILTNNLCQQFIDDPSDAVYCYRFIDEQFDTSRVLSAIEEIKNLDKNNVLFYSQRRKLLQQFLLINRLGYHINSPVYLREREGCAPKELTCKDLNKSEIKHLVIRCRSVYNNKNSSEVEIENARLVFIAIVREAIFKITRNIPYSTQILAVLISVMHKNSLLSEIDTGEGKAMVMAMVLANLWFEMSITAVNFATSNLELSHEAFNEFAPAFDLLGIMRGGNVLNAQTPVSDYCYTGINHFDVAQLSLFIAKQKLDPYYIKYYQNSPVSLALDEADYTFFDDTTHYRYATPLHQTDLNYVFAVLYEFIQSEKFKDERCTIENDITMARQLLLDKAKLLNKDEAYIAKLSDRQIDTWLESAIAASKLKEGKIFVVRTESRGVGEDAFNVSFARILSNSRVSEGAEWSNGVHQFLHTRLNEERVSKQLRIPAFPIDPETAPIASISSKNMIEHHMERGRVYGVTGTAGSREELKELTSLGIRSYRVPPHRPNRRVTEPVILANGEDDHFARILQAILKHLRQNEILKIWGYEPDKKPQPILVCFNDIDKSQRFYDYLLLNMDKLGWYKNILNTQLLNGSKALFNGVESTSPEKVFLSRGGVFGCITVSTLFGRGSDFKPRLNLSDIRQNHPFGLFVIQTYFASERESIQAAGRAGRQGFYGQYQLIADQKEFDELLDPSVRGIEAIAKLQQQRAQSEKSKRRFADRLSSVKNFFFTKFIEFAQDEKNMNSDINRKWAECLNNMDIEWHRLVTLYRQKKKLNEPDVLAKCTSDLIRKVTKDWNFLVPNDELFMLRPIEVEELILKPQVVALESDQTEDYYKSTLDMNDVSAARHYIENSPLYMTMGSTDKNVNEMIRQRIESKRLPAAYECISQIFGEVIDPKDVQKSLQIAFTNLIEKVYAKKNSIQYRKKLVEIFAIGQWSNDDKLQKDLSRIFLKRLYDFAFIKLSAFSGVNAVIDRKRIDNPNLTKEAVDIEALLYFLRETYDIKAIERQKELESMNTIETAVDTAKTVISSFFEYDTLPSVLLRLIELIDHPFTREQEKLTEVLKESESSVLFLGSWCAFFQTQSPTVSNDKMDLPAFNSAGTERSAGFVLV